MICFVILHYMVVNETRKCIESIKKIEGEKKIILVDNASPNNSFKELYNLYHEDSIVDLLESKVNQGYARGNNLGYNYALKKYNPEFIVVMNNDMEIKQKNFLKEIENAYDRHHFSILGPDIYATQTKYHQNPQTRKILSKKQLKRKYRNLYIKDKLRVFLYLKWKIKELFSKNIEKNNNYSNHIYIGEVIENPLLHGSCYILSRNFIDKHPDKCFFEGTFMYMEAEILYYQAIRDGEKMIYYPNLKVEHHEDKSTDAKLKSRVEKSIFSVKCLKDSVKSFIDLMENDGV
ncbi:MULTISPECIES: glycosyltransferase [Enterococcus]|uniref:glycosyltransferase n=1 Tax=Enterococcus TaxID=1350 RepID=UPI0002A27023|nr:MULTISPECIES: glycosyltransferase [Enterococcus]ELA66158.1 hypothetical protein OGK_03040 [Enterococcus faecium EnGen0019]ELA68074.1 hypothetical protein OGM_00591 [Enterococcus faecium EnGen0008]MCD5194836.1 glycosyltransferase family 2 protein [Enterococcus faecium]MCU2058148.1 glycosyltransferase [Enterococcus faecium]MEB4792110.1 glycosyltransferase [Enterococcus sp. E4-162]